MSDIPAATIVITTKDRRDELRVALASALTQTAACEVLVIDDGSTDGTADMVRREFTSVTLHRSERSLGLIVQRNRAAARAKGPVVFSLDDDAAYVSPRTVEQTLTEFDDPAVGAVAIPYVNVNQSPQVRQRAPGDSGVYVVERYIGVAHAVRRDLFLALGGYREQLFHQGEEGDFCLRLLAAGHFVRAGRADPLHHYVSPHRSAWRVVYYDARNHVLYAVQNAPLRALPVQLLGSAVRCLQTTPRHPLWVLHGLLSGLWLCVSGRVKRQPVRPDVWRLARHLKRHGPVPLDEVRPLLVPSPGMAERGDTRC